MKLILEIDLDNEAFSYNVVDAIEPISHQIINQMRSRPVEHGSGSLMRDENGNTVGFWDYRED